MNFLQVMRTRTGRLACSALVVWLVSAGMMPMSAAAATGTAPGARSGAAALSQDIRDIRPPYHLPEGWLWIGWLAAAAGLAGVGIVLWRRRSRTSLETLQELTLKKLEKTRALLDAGDVRGFSIAVSDVMRSYVEQRFQIRAMRRTTVEFLRDCLASADSPLRPHERTLTDFLTYCDLAKFARWTLAVAEMEAMLGVAKTLVQETAPVSPPSRAVPIAAAYAN